MSKASIRSLRRSLAGIPVNPLNPRKHPILSGAVKVVKYIAPAWRYGNRSSVNAN